MPSHPGKKRGRGEFTGTAKKSNSPKPGNPKKAVKRNKGSSHNTGGKGRGRRG